MNLFPTSCFPPISYIKEIVKHADISILGAETYPKQTERNRYSILTSQGVQWLTIPVKRIDGSKSISSRIEIDSSSDWQKKHWKAIETAYNASPFFEHYSNDLREIIFQQETNLVQFNLFALNKILRLFDINVSIKIENEFHVIDNEFFKEIESNLIPSYQQVLFKTKGFESNLSILDLLCCEGPIGRKIVKIG